MSLSCALAGRTITTELPAFIVGVVNMTPDSFWEESRASSVADGLKRAMALEAEGADIIEIGGESTRPGTSYITETKEIGRVVPLVREIRKHTKLPISVDTRKAGVMKAALDAGADLCNDVSALEDDPALGPLVRDAGIPVILMHKRGVPETMQADPRYGNAVREVAEYLFARARYAESLGIAREKIIVDPGIGFGKRYEDNCALISGLAEIARGGYPVLMALSRKTCIGQMTGRETGDRLAGTLAADLLSVMNGATFVRVHDVRDTRDTLAVLQEIRNRGIH